MEIYIIRTNEDIMLKTFHKIPCEIEKAVLSELHVKTSMDVLDKDNVWNAKKLKEFIDKHGNNWEYPPFIGFFQKLRSLDDNEYVVLCNFHPNGNFIHLCKIACKITAQGGVPSQAWDSSVEIEPTGRYNVYPILFQGIKQYIGERDKSKRVCRFCKGTGASLFRKDSHAISAFLGNDFVFCNEECDVCNQGFVKKLEQDLDDYYAVARSLDSCLNRDDKKVNFKGQDFQIDNSGNIPILTLKGIQSLDVIEKEGVSISLVNNKAVDVRNIYKCLVKYVISSLPSEELTPFAKTIEWVRGKLTPSHLPPLYRVETLNNLRRPELAIFIRKNDKKDVPYCIGRFAFLSNYYVFAVPYCQPYDVGNSMLKEALKRYVLLSENDISHYTVEDFNSNEKYNIVTHRTLHKDDKEPPDVQTRQ